MRAKTRIGLILVGAAAGGAGLWAARPDAGPPPQVMPEPSRVAVPPVSAAPPMATTEPELASWFEKQVVRHLEPTLTARRAAGGEREPHDEAGTADRAERSGRKASYSLQERRANERNTPARTKRQEALREELANDPNVDWDYLDAVYAGRISGIPNERKAGVPLREIDALGEVPYFEELREAGDIATLDSLDLPHQRNFPVCEMVSGRRFPVCKVL